VPRPAAALRANLPGSQACLLFENNVRYSVCSRPIFSAMVQSGKSVSLNNWRARFRRTRRISSFGERPNVRAKRLFRALRESGTAWSMSLTSMLSQACADFPSASVQSYLAAPGTVALRWQCQNACRWLCDLIQSSGNGLPLVSGAQISVTIPRTKINERHVAAFRKGSFT